MIHVLDVDSSVVITCFKLVCPLIKQVVSCFFLLARLPFSLPTSLSLFFSSFTDVGLTEEDGRRGDGTSFVTLVLSGSGLICWLFLVGRGGGLGTNLVRVGLVLSLFASLLIKESVSFTFNLLNFALS